MQLSHQLLQTGSEAAQTALPVISLVRAVTNQPMLLQEGAAVILMSVNPSLFLGAAWTCCELCHTEAVGSLCLYECGVEVTPSAAPISQGDWRGACTCRLQPEVSLWFFGQP